MPLTKQGDELVHAVGQGCRDETEAGCVTVDQVRVSARAFQCLLEVTLRPIHSKLKGANAVHRTFDEHGIILSVRLLINLGNNLDLIIKDCCTDEVRYRFIAVLLHTFLKDSILLQGETDVVEISPFLTIRELKQQILPPAHVLSRIGEGYKLSPSRNYTIFPALTGLSPSPRAKCRYNEIFLNIS